MVSRITIASLFVILFTYVRKYLIKTMVKNGLKLTNVLKKSVEVSGPLKTMGTALHTGLTLSNGTLETWV